MIKRAISLGCLAVALAAAAPARADETYEGAARKARRVEGASLAALFWSQLDDCGQAGNDYARRQCLGVRAARRAQLASQAFVVAGGAGALHPKFDARAKSIGLAIEACVACDGGVEVAGKKRYLAGAGRRAITGGALRTAALGQVLIPASTPAEADAWKAETLTRLRSEFVIKLPGKLDSWRAGDLAGYGVEVVAFKVWDPCDGSVVAARPAASRGEVDKATCPAKKAPVVADQPKVEDKPAKVEPDRVSANAINQALVPVRAASQKCLETYGVTGTATLKITFDKAGQITALVQDGDFTETPTGACIEKAARQVVFPPSQKKATTISYPITLE